MTKTTRIVALFDPESLQQREAGIRRHVDVEEDGVGRLGADRRDGRIDGRRLADDLDLGMRRKHRAQLLAREALVIDQQ